MNKPVSSYYILKQSVKREREACANLRKDIPLIGKHSVDYEEGFWDGLAAYEAAIRARSEKSSQPKGF